MSGKAGKKKGGILGKIVGALIVLWFIALVLVILMESKNPKLNQWPRKLGMMKDTKYGPVPNWFGMLAWIYLIGFVFAVLIVGIFMLRREGPIP